MNGVQIKKLQTDLMYEGFDPGPIDGVLGPRTSAAIIAFKRAIGYAATAFVGPLTLAALARGKPLPDTDPINISKLPWMVEAVRYVGLHEVADNAELRKWLASDGHALGDPAKLPWCGDFVETAIRLGLPNEPVPNNPYWALNWRAFGVACDPVFGAVASVKRDGGGHVGFLVGQDATRFYLLGGNQANRTSVAPMDKSRFPKEAFRFPATYRPIVNYLPTMTSTEASNITES